jgi:hypothetical protein
METKVNKGEYGEKLREVSEYGDHKITKDWRKNK